MDPRTVRVFLVDGSPSGMLVAEIMNFSGKVIVAPRTRIGELTKRPEANRPGVYFLVGDDPDNVDREIVYIGETDDILRRLNRHNNKGQQQDSKADSITESDEITTSDFWTRVAFVTSTDENLTKGHIRYLESILIRSALEAKRATIRNKNTPPISKQHLPESDRADMHNFVNQLQLQLAILGFTFLKPMPAQDTSQNNKTGTALLANTKSPLFELVQGGVTASATEIGDEFVVLKGSLAREDGKASWTSYKSLRERLIIEGKLQQTNTQGSLVFSEDVPFKSPSAAASVILARNANGRVEWRSAGTTLSYGQWDDARNKTLSDTIEVQLIKE